MYICICNAVTESDIRQAVENGVGNLRELRFATGCSMQCGSCEEVAESVLHDALSDQEAVPELRVVSPLTA